MKKMYTCVSCGFKTLKEVLSEYEDCKICNFTDTNGGLNYPFEPNFTHDDTLYDYQQKFLNKIPFEKKEYKKGNIIYKRNELWRPINKDKFDKNHDYFPRWKFDEFYEKYPKHSEHHKKLMEEAQKYNSDEKVHLKI